MNLQGEIDAARADIRTDSYAISIGEWISLYEKDELDIHPEFQRFFRWSPEQKSRFIESILLGIPIPQIFVSQRSDGVWDVVDGVQRLSTIFQLIGILKKGNGGLVDPLTLTKTKYLPSLANRMWDCTENPDRSLTNPQRLLIKRSKLDVSIILRESEEKTKYELFQRLNTGGSNLSDQEVRNVILVMINREFSQWISELAQIPDFMDCVALTDRALDQRYDLELVLRFLVLRRANDDKLRNIGDLGDFLTDKMTSMAEDNSYDRNAEEQAFRATFSLLNRCLDSNAFRRWDNSKMKFKGGFSVSAFEAVALGIGFSPNDTVNDCDKLKDLIRGIWTDDAFTTNAGSGIRASGRIPQIIPYGRKRYRA